MSRPISSRGSIHSTQSSSAEGVTGKRETDTTTGTAAPSSSSRLGFISKHNIKKRYGAAKEQVKTAKEQVKTVLKKEGKRLGREGKEFRVRIHESLTGDNSPKSRLKRASQDKLTEVQTKFQDFFGKKSHADDVATPSSLERPTEAPIGYVKVKPTIGDTGPAASSSERPTEAPIGYVKVKPTIGDTGPAANALGVESSKISSDRASSIHPDDFQSPEVETGAQTAHQPEAANALGVESSKISSNRPSSIHPDDFQSSEVEIVAQTAHQLETSAVKSNKPPPPPKPGKLTYDSTSYEVEARSEAIHPDGSPSPEVETGAQTAHQIETSVKPNRPPLPPKPDNLATDKQGPVPPTRERQATGAIPPAPAIPAEIVAAMLQPTEGRSLAADIIKNATASRREKSNVGGAVTASNPPKADFLSELTSHAKFTKRAAQREAESGTEVIRASQTSPAKIGNTAAAIPPPLPPKQGDGAIPPPPPLMPGIAQSMSIQKNNGPSIAAGTKTPDPRPPVKTVDSPGAQKHDLLGEMLSSRLFNRAKNNSSDEEK